jgi:hypothetical protein
VRKRTGARSRLRNPSAFVLDVFTERNLDDWSTRSVVAQRYLDHVYFDLERQRVEHFEELREALSGVSPITVDVTNWVRITDYRWSLEPLSPAGSLKGIGGRFNIGVELDRARGQHFPALYLADAMDTALREFFLGPPEDRTASLSLQELALRRLSSFAAFTLRGHVDQVFDLRSTQELAAFAAIVSRFSLSKKTRRLPGRSGLRPRLLVKTPEELRWRILSDPQKWRTQPQMFGIPASSQTFGRLVRDAGFEAILYPSQRAAGMNLAVFVENFRDSSSRIEVVGGAPAGATFLTLDKDSLKNQEWSLFLSRRAGD